MRLTHDSFLCEEMGPVTEGAREYADLPLGLQWEKGFQQTPGAFHNVTGHPSCPVFCGTPFPTGGLEHPPPHRRLSPVKCEVALMLASSCLLKTRPCGLLQEVQRDLG